MSIGRTVGKIAVVLIGAGAALDGVSAVVGGSTTTVVYGGAEPQVVTAQPSTGERVARLVLDVVVIGGCAWGWQQLSKKRKS